MTNAERHVLYTVNGPQNFLVHRRPVADRLAALGWQIDVAGPPGNGVDDVRAAGYTYHALPLDRRSMNPAREAATVQGFIRLYRRLRPGLVHHFTIKPVIYGGLAARVARVPRVVHTITGLGHLFANSGDANPLARKIAIRGYKLSFAHPQTTVIFQNTADQGQLESCGVAPMPPSVLLPGSGVDTHHFAALEPPTNETPTVVLAGRMLRSKGVETFVDAARSLRQSGVRARMVLVGDADPGNPASISTPQLRAWHDEGIIEWWGWQADMLEILRQTDIACLPSDREGFPRFVMEASACARPAIVTDVPGCRDAVKDGKTGLLVPARDAPALAAAVERLVHDASLRRRLGRQARAHAEQAFDVAHVAERTIRLYERDGRS